MTDNKRLLPYKALPEAYKLMMALENGVRGLGLPESLLHLIRLRASQINGCAYCISLHSREARENGERQRRLDLLQAWRETTLFDAREQAALAWTETLTRLGEEAADETTYAELIGQFGDRDAVAVTMAIVAINGWNRISIGFRSPPEQS